MLQFICSHRFYQCTSAIMHGVHFFTTYDNSYLFVIVMATFTQIPVNTSALVGTTAQFNCTADGVAGMTYFLNSMTIAAVTSNGVSAFLSTPVYNDSLTSVYLYVTVTRDMNNWPVVCIAYLFDETREDSSPTAYLQIQGLCQCNVYYYRLKWELAYKCFYTYTLGEEKGFSCMSRHHSGTPILFNVMHCNRMCIETAATNGYTSKHWEQLLLRFQSVLEYGLTSNSWLQQERRHNRASRSRGSEILWRTELLIV